ncbi:MAG: type IV pilus modification PilV family protein [Thermodesulfobacteriota bacterium]
MNNFIVQKNNGFTLLEVMVAVGILAFALVSLLGAVNRNIILTTNSRNTELAANLANEMMTKIEIEGIPDVRQDSGEFEDHPGFKWFLSIEPFNLAQLEAAINVVRVVITWDEGEEVYELNLAVENKQ